MSFLPPAVLTKLQANTKNIRNICVLAHVDHGKTSLSDFLVSSNGIISQKVAGGARYLDSREDEQIRGITMESSSIALIYKVADETATAKSDPAKPSDSKPESKKESEQNSSSSGSSSTSSGTGSTLDRTYLVNLIDSPGHIDFSSEVSSAVRLSDGALVVVDVVEGACIQTEGVLAQAWNEGVQPCLVINKMDKLINHLKLTPMEAYLHICKILEQINAFTSTFITAEAMEKARATSINNDAEIDESSYAVDIDDDRQLIFSPERGNVVFASAADAWGFRISDFIDLYANKLSMNKEALAKVLWGEFYYNPKTKKCTKKPDGKIIKPMFVQFILEPIWEVYKAASDDKDDKRLQQITTSLGLKVPAREIQVKETRLRVRAVLQRWLPIATTVMSMVASNLPSPIQAQKLRMGRMWGGVKAKADEQSAFVPKRLRRGVLTCDPTSPHVLAFVAKMIHTEGTNSKAKPVPSAGEGAQEAVGARSERKEYVPQKQRNAAAAAASEQPVVQPSVVQPAAVQPSAVAPSASSTKGSEKVNSSFVGVCRLYSGTITVNSNQVLNLFAPKYNPADPSTFTHAHQVQCSNIRLFIFMGREMVEVETVSAGNVFGIMGIEQAILKTGTISTVEKCLPFKAMSYQSHGLVRVAVEPVKSTDMEALRRGLKLLNQADASVEVKVQETGELVIVCAGELHLERCIKDLKDTFAKGVEMRVSAPIVGFRETFVRVPELLSPTSGNSGGGGGSDDEDGGSAQVEDGDPELCVETTPNKCCVLKVRAVPLPASLSQLLETKHEVLKRMAKRKKQHVGEEAKLEKERGKERQKEAEKERQREAEKEDGEPVEVEEEEDAEEKEEQELIAAIKQEMDSAAGFSAGILQDDFHRICALGPRGWGTNLLVNRAPDLSLPPLFPPPEGSVEALLGKGPIDKSGENPVASIASVEAAIINGFQMICKAGGLCEEPLMGVLFAIEDIKVKQWDTTKGADPYGPLSGQVMSTMKSVCRRAVSVPCHSPRLMEPVYKADLQCGTEGLGNLYAVITKRRGKIIAEDMREGTNMFVVRAFLPVAESFGFTQDVRTRTSGIAQPQLFFSHWQLIDMDPFFMPRTEEELEEFGDQELLPNLARTLLDSIRRRKGLAVETKLVKAANKQRTLARKK